MKLLNLLFDHGVKTLCLLETSIARGDTKDSSIKPIIMKYNKGNKDILVEKYLDVIGDYTVWNKSRYVRLLSEYL